MYILTWLRSWWTGARLLQHVDAMKNRIDVLRRERARSDQRIDNRLEELSQLREQLVKVLDKTRDELNEGRELNKRLEAALTIAQGALESAEQITIPGLVAANQAMIARWEAESSVLAMRKAALGVDRSD